MSMAIIKKFDKVQQLADDFNSRDKSKRIQIMTHSHFTKVVEVGFYDTVSKKYIVTDVRAHDAYETVEEMIRALKRLSDV